MLIIIIAYIVSVVGNYINNNFKNAKKEFVYTDYIKEFKKREKKYKINGYGLAVEMFRYDRRNWNKDEQIELIKKTVNYKDCFITMKLEELTSEFYDQNASRNNESCNSAIKEDKDIKKYGGYSQEKKAYYAIIKYKNDDGKEEAELIGVPVQVATMLKATKKSLKDYLRDKYNNVEVLKEKILKYQLFEDENGLPFYLTSDSEIKIAKQLLLSKEYTKVVYDMNKKKLFELNEREILELQMNGLYDYLVEKMKNNYLIFEKLAEKIKKNKNLFLDLEFEDKRKVINGIIDVMNGHQGNLKLIKLGEREGRLNGKKFKNNKLHSITFIYYSVTGVYIRKEKF